MKPHLLLLLITSKRSSNKLRRNGDGGFSWAGNCPHKKLLTQRLSTIHAPRLKTASRAEANQQPALCGQSRLPIDIFRFIHSSIDRRDVGCGYHSTLFGSFFVGVFASLQLGPQQHFILNHRAQTPFNDRRVAASGRYARPSNEHPTPVHPCRAWVFNMYPHIQ